MKLNFWNKPRSLYFAYGANMSKESMKARCPKAEAIKPYYLLGWRLMFSHHATIVPDAGSCVPGVLWNITEECEKNLDRFEGYPEYYTKIWLSQHGRSFMAYEMNPPLNPRYTPHDSYVNLLKQGYLDWELEQKYLQEALHYYDYD